MEVIANEKSKFLSEVIDIIPSNCLLDKGLTGCGGTTMEINSERNSLILVPNINIVLNKTAQIKNLIGVYGDITQVKFKKEMQKKTKHKKIIATYNALAKIISWVGKDIYDYFLLVDEYHILFNYYRLRYKAISYVLDNYKKFKTFCFVTAIPLAEYNVLKELKDLKQVKLIWPQAIDVKVNLITTTFTTKKLINYIKESLSENYNLHIFINSLKTITSVINGIQDFEYRTICSKDAEKKIKNLEENLMSNSLQVQ